MLARLINLLKNYNKNKQKSNKEKTRSILERGRQRSTHHDHHRPWGHVILQTRIEGLSSQLTVVLRQEILRHLSNRDRFNKKLADHTHTHTLQTLIPAPSSGQPAWIPAAQTGELFARQDGVELHLVSRLWESSPSHLEDLMWADTKEEQWLLTILQGRL